MLKILFCQVLSVVVLDVLRPFFSTVILGVYAALVFMTGRHEKAYRPWLTSLFSSFNYDIPVGGSE